MTVPAGEQARRCDWHLLEFGIVRAAGIPAQRLSDVLAFADATQAVDALWREAAQPEIRAAIWYNTPEFLEHLDRELARDRRPPRMTRTLYGYLQRACAKNDTISRFGPVDYLDIEGDVAGMPQRAGMEDAACAAPLSFWACEALARHIARDPELIGDIPLRIVPPLRRPSGVRVRDGAAAMLAAIATAPRSPVALACAADDPAEAMSAIATLLREGHVEPALLPHPIAFDPLQTLIAAVLGLPESGARARWLRHCRALALEAERFAATTDLALRDAANRRAKRRLAILAATPAPEDPDRRPFSEDARLAGGPLRMAEAQWRELTENLRVPLLLMAARAEAWRTDWRNWAAELLAAGGVRRGRVPLAEVARVIARAGHAPTIDPRQTTRFDTDLAALVAATAPDADGTVRLDAGALEKWVAGWQLPTITFASPDILLRRDGQPVIGEVHGGALVWGCLLRFAGEARIGRLRDTLAMCLVDLPAVPCELMSGRRRGRSFLIDLPCAAVEASDPAGPHARARIDFNDIIVDTTSDFALSAPGFDRPLELLRSTWTGPFADVFAVEIEGFAIGDGERRPRVQIGAIVFQRAAWRLDGRSLHIRLATAPGGDTRGVLAALCHRLSIPPCVFVRVARRTKPVYLDLRSPICADWLRHAVSPDEPVHVTEALPLPKEAWLDAGKGPVTCELRLSACLRPAQGAAR